MRVATVANMLQALSAVVGCCGSSLFVHTHTFPAAVVSICLCSDIQNTAHTNVRFLVRASYLQIYSQCCTALCSSAHRASRLVLLRCCVLTDHPLVVSLRCALVQTK